MHLRHQRDEATASSAERPRMRAAKAKATRTTTIAERGPRRARTEATASRRCWVGDWANDRSSSVEPVSETEAVSV